MRTQDGRERLGRFLGSVGVRAEVSVGLVEQRLAERRGALGSLVVGYALKELGFAGSLERRKL